MGSNNNYFGSHRNGEDCPCGPSLTAKQRNGKWTMVMVHKAPEEELDMTEQEIMSMVNDAIKNGAGGGISYGE